MIGKLKASALALCVSAILSACGGGGDSADNPVSTASTAPPAALQGAYEGTTNTVYNPAFTMLVLEDGSTWLLYGDRINGFLYTSGLIQGTLQFSNGTLNSASDFRDYGDAPATAISLKGNYDSTPSLTGTVSANGESGKFQAARPATRLYNYDTPANLSEIAGNWQTTTPEGDGVTIQIAADGSYSGVDAFGCTASGKLAPRPSGKNVFNLSFQVGNQASCDLPNTTGSGVAVVYDLADGRQQIVLMVVDNVQKFGTAYLGARSKSLRARRDYALRDALGPAPLDESVFPAANAGGHSVAVAWGSRPSQSAHGPRGVTPRCCNTQTCEQGASGWAVNLQTRSPWPCAVNHRA